MTTSLTKGFPQRCPVRGLGASRRPFGAARFTGHRCATEMRTLRNDTLNHQNNVSTLSGDLTFCGDTPHRKGLCSGHKWAFKPICSHLLLIIPKMRLWCG